LNPADITFVVLTKDEESNIEACLRSLPAGAITLVYDAESQDQTRAIAARLGAQIVVAPWGGFVTARQNAAGLVKTQWTFMLDADERVTPALVGELQELEPPPAITAYSLPRRNVFCGRWITTAGWWPDRLVRLFRTGKASARARSGEGETALHEDWQSEGASAALASAIEHHSYPTTQEYRAKFARYTATEARNLKGDVLALIVACIAFPLRFFWLFFVRGGVLQGWRGAYVCAGSAFYPVAAAWKAARLHG